MQLISTTGTQIPADPTGTGGQTLDALMARQKALMEQAAQPMPAQIASPWQGAALMAQGLSNNLQQHQVVQQQLAGRQALAAAMSKADPTTGELPPDAQATIMSLSPEMGYKFIADSMANRRAMALHQLERGEHLADVAETERFTQANQETWKQDPTDPTKYVSSRGNVEYKQPQKPMPNWIPDPDHPGQYIDTTKQNAPQAAPKPPENWVPDPTDPTGRRFVETTHQQPPKTPEDPNMMKPGDIGAMRGQLLQDKNYQSLVQAKPMWDSITDAARRDNPQSDLNVILGMAKLFDPNSVVRTSEGEEVVQTGGKWAELGAAFQKLKRNPQSGLGDKIKEQLLQEGYSRMKGYTDQYNQTADFFTNAAHRQGVQDTSTIVPPVPEIKPYEIIPGRPDVTADNLEYTMKKNNMTRAQVIQYLMTNPPGGQ